MNANEGLNRIAKVIRYLGYGIGACLIVLGAWAGATSDSPSKFEGFLIVWGSGVLCIGGGWITAWIIEGFAKAKE